MKKDENVKYLLLVLFFSAYSFVIFLSSSAISSKFSLNFLLSHVIDIAFLFSLNIPSIELFISKILSCWL